MAAPRDTWSVSHFSLANPVGPNRASVPEFLRQLAAELDRRPGVEVQDIVFRMELADDGEDCPTATVYFYPQGEQP